MDRNARRRVGGRRLVDPGRRVSALESPPVNRRGWLPALALPLALLAGCGGDEPAAPVAAGSEPMTVTSTAFQEGGTIPAEFPCPGAGHRPPLAWTGGEGARSYAIVV